MTSSSKTVVYFAPKKINPDNIRSFLDNYVRDTYSLYLFAEENHFS